MGNQNLFKTMDFINTVKIDDCVDDNMSIMLAMNVDACLGHVPPPPPDSWLTEVINCDNLSKVNKLEKQLSNVRRLSHEHKQKVQRDQKVKRLNTERIRNQLKDVPYPGQFNKKQKDYNKNTQLARNYNAPKAAQHVVTGRATLRTSTLSRM